MKRVTIAAEEVMGDTSEKNHAITGFFAVVVCVTYR